MSRYEGIDNDGNPYAYGFDQVLFYWLDVYKPGTEQMPEDDDLIAEFSYAPLTEKGKQITKGWELVEKLDEYGINFPKEHREAMLLDLPF